MREVPVAIAAFIIYLVVSGSFTPYDVVTGIIVAVTAGLLFGGHLVNEPRKALSPKRWLYFIVYLLKYVTVIELRAHFDVMKRVITNDVKPGIVRAPIRCKTDYGKYLVASSITNTPGTVTVDVGDGRIYVNWIYVSTDDEEERRKEIFGEFEEYAVKIFEGDGE
ncbi:Na+/H+ antiporter subunit E [Thermococcus barophilus]|uniref:Membrane bound subgroup 4b [NiFe]-hydrogenase MBH(B)1, subunit Mbh(B)1A n=1 Tax=Thermococcus barophilus TaxID=55802 RepID=A0A0S1X9Y9_THEBA|nr:Na+/H+ antiporter subunit E [Thermococcus barophilus]ALM74606.1 Membrane bound subgroup 4b [NiFe]-hydrogenase MBH(b)1, subunit Mbh(b)1A [Thermococcus barophilus]